MNSVAVPTGTRPRFFGSPGGRGRWFEGIGVTGFAIAAAATLLLALNSTSRVLWTEPLDEWFDAFLYSTARHGVSAIAILLAVVWARNRFPARGIGQYAIAAGAAVAASAASWVAIEAWETDGEFGLVPGFTLIRHLYYVGGGQVHSSSIGLVIACAWLYLCAEAEHTAAAEQCAIDAARMARQTAEARLQMLEAQIEPHFLFNTLAHVRRLYETDPAAGARMLHNLAGYLASALPQMRTAATLGHELDHITAYLNIQQIRMGHRLTFAIDAPEAARDAALPPLMVLTLVENAIKHGLSPLREGGRIDVRASVAGGRLIVQVADTGQGFTQSSGGGTGLANTRARLASKYGAGASFSLAHNEPRGVVATISLPYEAVAAVGSPP